MLRLLKVDEQLHALGRVARAPSGPSESRPARVPYSMMRLRPAREIRWPRASSSARSWRRRSGPGLALRIETTRSREPGGMSDIVGADTESQLMTGARGEWGKARIGCRPLPRRNTSSDRNREPPLSHARPGDSTQRILPDSPKSVETIRKLGTVRDGTAVTEVKSRPGTDDGFTWCKRLQQTTDLRAGPRPPLTG